MTTIIIIKDAPLDTLPCGHSSASVVALGKTSICLECQDPTAQNALLRLFAPYVSKQIHANTSLDWLQGIIR